MGVLTRTRQTFPLGDATDPLGRSLLVEQFRMVRKQIPVLYAVLLLYSISIGPILPGTVSAWLGVALPVGGTLRWRNPLVVLGFSSARSSWHHVLAALILLAGTRPAA
ncbi:hypothetical protein QCM80_38160 [Bradyrhizobium sp. SSUT112]|uniref:hypothetical protein n=1 Tax=Bradyrhizobium sp. SSUT112 TaxID=3040604 RepID=UPI00244706CE|nr:hypothetical protein [Bradyrhizobium sp. SSUT112]MDH2356438.1 hypothetical protein [Bradyrhizobium sp. SSUT112]